jgi:hypothetical protein
MTRRGLEAINMILFVVAILGFNLKDFAGKTLDIWHQILISLILCAIYAWAANSKRFEKHHVFKENSSKFRKFFADWYSQEGVLSIYCNDLCWLSSEENKKILEVIKNKKNKLNVYIKENINDDIVKELTTNGAKIYQRKDGMKTAHRMSILDTDGIEKIIIRNQDVASDEVVFIETNSCQDPYLLGLAGDVLHYCVAKKEE